MKITNGKLIKLLRRYKRYVILGGALGILIFGLAIYFYLNPRYDYPKTNTWVTFRTNVVFHHPENWKVGSCGVLRPFIELPGTLKGNYKGSENYDLVIRAYAACEGERAILNYTEIDSNSQTVCEKGERLSNGLVVGLNHYSKHKIRGVLVYDSSCQDEVISFVAHDAKHTIASSDYDANGIPTVDQDTFIASPQYQDIKRFAESIRPSSE